MISKYNSFLEDKILESLINESFLYLSPNVRKILGKMFTKHHSDIAADILSSEGTDVKPDMTFIDLGKEGYLSFITMKNAKPLVLAKYPNVDWANNIDNVVLPDPKLYTNDLYEFDINKDKDSTGVFIKSRNEVGIGRFINKLFPGKYNSKQIEEFVNIFKSSIHKSGEYFDEVIGKDIEYWYSYENYKEMSGTLGNSCMAKKSDLFDIYIQNQDVCKMLILVEDDKLIGRALVWKIKNIKSKSHDVEGVEYFMDRQYTIKESDVEKFKNYAKDRGWAFKAYNNHHSCTTISFKDKIFNCDMQVQLAVKTYNNYPYMDTFRRYDPESGILYNDNDEGSEYEGQYILDNTGGGYTEIEGGVWSEYNDRRIPEDEAVYSNYLSDYLLRDRSFFVERGSRQHIGWYPDDYDYIVMCNDRNYYHADDTVFSEIYQEYIFRDDAVLVVCDIHNDGDVDSPGDSWLEEGDSSIVYEREYRSMTWYKFLSNKFSDWNDYSGINKDLLVKNHKDYWIPKMFEEEVFKVAEAKSEDAAEIIGNEYLLKEDAEILGWNIDKSNSKIVDAFEYSKDISHLLKDIQKRVIPLIKHYDQILNGEGQQRIKFSEEEERQYLNRVERKIKIFKQRLEDIEEEKYYTEN